MIEIKIDLEIKYKEPDVNEYFLRKGIHILHIIQ